MDELASFRLVGMRMLTGTCASCTAIVAGGTLFAGSGVMPLVLVVAAGGLPMLLVMQGHTDPTKRLILGASVTACPIIFLYQWP
jgi:hypothetical protein